MNRKARQSEQEIRIIVPNTKAIEKAGLRNRQKLLDQAIEGIESGNGSGQVLGVFFLLSLSNKRDKIGKQAANYFLTKNIKIRS